MTRQSISIGTIPNDGTGDPIRTAFTKSNSNFSELYGRAANATDVYGALPDGTTAIDSAIAAAIAASVTTLVFDQGASFYSLTSTINMPAGFSIIAGRGRPTIKMNNASDSRMFVFSGVADAHLRGITIDGNKAVGPTDATVVMSSGTTLCSIEDVKFQNCPSASTGAVVLSGASTIRNSVRNCQFDGCEGASIGISSGCENTIAFNDIRTSGNFGIWLGAGALRNAIIGNRSITSGLEAIAITYDCSYNRIIGNHCELAGDNGISISGSNNVVSGNICLSNAKAGIGVWGSQNTISGNILEQNNFGNTTSYWSGVWIQSNYGGTGSFNVVSGNVADDAQVSPTQNYAVNIQGNGYVAWGSGQTGIVSGTSFTQNGLNIYVAASSGTTGSTPPTHTSGTVSDGGVSWTWVNSFATTAGALWNHVADNVVRRFKTAAYVDNDNWQHNVLFSSTTTSMTITADGLARARPL